MMLAWITGIKGKKKNGNRIKCVSWLFGDEPLDFGLIEQFPLAQLFARLAVTDSPKVENLVVKMLVSPRVVLQIYPSSFCVSSRGNVIRTST